MAVSKSARAAAPREYHHGDLRAALLAAAWSIVAEEGLGALTLRACARRAGVSHAAPEHHFGNLAGLLEEFAADGYERMAAVMDEVAAEPETDSQLFAAGLGYVRFAQAYPEHFRVMAKVASATARSARLRAASAAARSRLEGSLRAAYVAKYGREPTPEALRVKAAIAWSCVHGYAAIRADRLASDADLPDAETMLVALRPAVLAE